jgi:hypothetical protein
MGLVPPIDPRGPAVDVADGVFTNAAAEARPQMMSRRTARAALEVLITSPFYEACPGGSGLLYQLPLFRRAERVNLDWWVGRRTRRASRK